MAVARAIPMLMLRMMAIAVAMAKDLFVAVMATSVFPVDSYGPEMQSESHHNGDMTGEAWKNGR